MFCLFLSGCFTQVKLYYNHATSNLAIYSNETSQDKLSEASNRLSIIVIQVHDNLHAHSIETIKVVENLF